MAEADKSEIKPDVEVPEEAPAETKRHHESASKLERFKTWYTERKKWTIPASILLVLLILAGLPLTRYPAVGLFYKKDFTVSVKDATANTPVSGATVAAEGQSAITNGRGQAKLHLGVGKHTFSITKKYYHDQNPKLFVPIMKQNDSPVDLTATGRQVKITVVNTINKQKLGGVGIKVAGISAKTDQNGSAVIVLPIGVSEQKGVLSLTGYNDGNVTIKVSNDSIKQNDFGLTPAGKVYFLSKLSGKIDVVKTNLDGTVRQTVLPGTGNEQETNTVLLASRDWKYLALLSRRAGTSPSLYLISTADDSLTTMDEGSADFNLNGWVGDSFVYTVTRSEVPQWQSNHQAIKAYNAQTKKIVVLDQTAGAGNNGYDYIAETYGSVYGYDDQIFYIKNWTASYYNATQLAGKQATFNSVKTDASGKKALRSFGVASGASTTYISLESRVESPDHINLKFNDGNDDKFYVYAEGQIKEQSNVNSDTFYNANYPTYLQSPSGSSTFWADARDGKNTLFIGDEDGQNAKQIASLSEYNTYGWYSDNYLLVSKNSSELYVMPKGGSAAPLKISDYHKPALTFYGYGGGYGGL